MYEVYWMQGQNLDKKDRFLRVFKTVIYIECATCLLHCLIASKKIININTQE
jgi:hypothetical protein